MEDSTELLVSYLEKELGILVFVSDDPTSREEILKRIAAAIRVCYSENDRYVAVRLLTEGVRLLDRRDPVAPRAMREALSVLVGGCRGASLALLKNLEAIR
jgi:hypothetical protein